MKITKIVFIICLLSAGASADAASWNFKAEFLPHLVKSVPIMLADQETTSGHFGKGTLWIVQDQNALFPLAAAWSYKHPDNPYYHDPKVLTAIISGGNALIEEQDSKGMWVFRKKDKSTWGDIYMPWTYSRWIRAFGLIREAMPAEDRARWEKALTLGFDGIARTAMDHDANIPTHHAMGLYHAGQLFNRADWKTSATAYMAHITGKQHPDGYWTEHCGPVVGYNYVYIDAIGIYYAMSKDPVVLPALERAAKFHVMLTYPDGSHIETVDERQVYHAGADMPNSGFSHTPEGRGHAQRQWEMVKRKGMGGDGAAAYLLYGQEGEVVPPPPLDARHLLLSNDSALVHGEGPWTVCLSAYDCEISKSRWIQDRQNIVSLFNTKTGLIMGGGNSKLTPGWSTFTVGDTSRFKHKAGEEEPNFIPPSGFWHVPTKIKLDADKNALDLEYGTAQVRVQADTSSAKHARLIYSLVPDTAPAESATSEPVTAHLPLIAHFGKPWKTESGKSGEISTTSLMLSAAEAGGWIEHHGWKVLLPAGSSVEWPVLPHNQYRKDGSATPEEGRLVVHVPLTAAEPKKEVAIETVK